MSRCKCCDVVLIDTELTKKDVNGEFLDTCNSCLPAGFFGHIYKEGKLIGFEKPMSMTDPKGDIDSLYGVVGEVMANGKISVDT